MASSANGTTSWHIRACRGASPNPRFRQKKVSCSLIFLTKSKTPCKETVGSIRLFLLFFELTRKSSAGDFIKTISLRAFHADWPAGCLSVGLPTRQEQAWHACSCRVKRYYFFLFLKLKAPPNPTPSNIPSGKFLKIIPKGSPKHKPIATQLI